MRADLLALTDESLAVLANVGLVKRAHKELEAGHGPTLTEEPDGTVVAAARDGASTRLPPGATLKASHCSCGASTVCRHRIAVVLAYRQRHGASPATAAPWNPGEFDDEAVRVACGSTLALAEQLRRQSCLVTVVPGAVPSARLPTATVQFLVPHSLSFAKCDCVAGGGCAHVALAVWAFRAAPPDGGPVELGTLGLEPAIRDTLTVVVAAVAAAARLGLGDATLGGELARGRAAAEDAGLVWLADALEDLERQADAYARQSARFSARASANLIAELAGRVRAARHGRALPPRFYLGADEARETMMEQVRLIALGVALEADQERRFASVYFANPDSKQVLVLRKEWRFDRGAEKNGAQLGALYASSRLSLSALAQGELVTRAAKRRASGELDLSIARGMKTSLLPGGLGWSELPEPLKLENVERKAELERGAPPALLRPRRLGADVHVVAVGRVVDVTWARGAQELIALLEDKAGNRVIVRVPHRAVSPEAVDGWAHALCDAPQLVSGRLHKGRDGWQLDPLAVVGARMVVPALAPPAAVPRTLQPHDELEGAAGDALDQLLAQLDQLVQRAVVKGARAVARDAAALATAFAHTGMPRLADALTALAQPTVERPAEQALVELCLLDALLPPA